MSNLDCSVELEREGHAYVGDPVDVVTGAVVDSAADFRVHSAYPLVFRRFYSSARATEHRGVGAGFRHSFDHWLYLDLDGIAYHAPNGARVALPTFADGGTRVSARGYVLWREGARLRLRNPAGNELLFEIHGSTEARLVEIRSRRDGPSIRLTYALDGTLVALVDAEGREVELVLRDGRLAEARIRALDGNWITLARYRYAAALLVEVEDGYRHKLRYEYDTSGRLARRIDRRGYAIAYRYDSDGRCVESAGEDGVLSVALEYFPPERRTKVVRGDGGVWEYAYDAAGTITGIRSPRGNERVFRTRPEDGQVVRAKDGAGNAATTIFDADGRPRRTEDADGRAIVAPQPHRRPRNPAEYELGAWARLPQKLPSSGHAASRPAAAQAVLEVARDGVDGKLREVRDLQGILVREERDGRSRRFGYDPNGNLRFRTDLDGCTVRYETASFNQRVARVSELGLVTRFEHSKEDLLAAVVDAGGTRTEYPRDLEGNVTAIVRAGAIRERYTYDGAGRLSEKRDALGRVLFTLLRGAQGEVLDRAFAHGGFERYTHDAALRVIAADTADASCSFAYDAFGQRISDLREGAGVERRFNGQDLTSHVVLGRFATTYRHSEEALFNGESGTRKAITLTDPTGREHRLVDHGAGVFSRHFASGRAEHAQVHPDGHFLSKTVVDDRAPDAPAWQRTYLHSPEGYLVQRHDSERGVTSYEHDGDHRICSEALPDGTVRNLGYTPGGSLFEYGDRYAAFVGNLLHSAIGDRTFEHDHRQAVSVEAWPGAYRRFHRDERDQLVRIESYRQDGAGTFQLSAPWTAKYDAFGRRFEKTVGTAKTTYVWDTDRLAAEVRPSGALRVYVYADALALTPMLFVDYASVDAAPESGEVYAVFADQLGCPERIEDMQSRVVWRGQADVYGLVTVTEGHDFHQPIRWPGHLWDEELQLQYNRFRTYSPELGRYLEPDPVGRAGGHENVYAYTQNPLFRVDVCGLDPCGNGRADGDGHGDDGEAKPVQELEVDAYGELNKRAVVGDGIEHDHIPSFAAVRDAINGQRAAAGLDPLTPSEAYQLKQNLTTIAMAKDTHAQSRTYKGANDPGKRALDSKNLQQAENRDVAVARDNLLAAGHPPDKVDNAIKDLQARNRDIGLHDNTLPSSLWGD